MTLQINNFSIGFEGKDLLNKVSTVFPSGKLTALIGRNGTGKSTLMKAISGLNENYSGSISIGETDIKTLIGKKLAHQLAYVNTQRPRLSNLRCKDIVALGRTPYTNWNGKLSQKDLEIVDNALEMVGMNGYKDRYFNTLSDGESQKIMIARAIAQDTDIIILDEPTSFLDLPTRHELVKLLKKLTTEKGKTIIFSTHELDISLKYADQIALIQNTQLINLPTKKMEESNHLESFLPSE